MSTQKIFKVIGIMSGTSMDGLDCSFIETDGENFTSVIVEKSYHYPKIYKNKLKKIIQVYDFDNKKMSQHKDESFITKKFIQILKKFILDHRIDKKLVDLISVSGQTIYHNPRKKKSIQYGSCTEIQKKFKINVIGNFRKNDIKNGGQGAPIGAFYHKYIIETFAKNSAIINIGGVSNISFINNNKLFAFDLGPGNALIDDLMYYFFKKDCDLNGKIAFKGKINKKLINEFKEDNFFKLNYPKSLDREYFKKYFQKLININKYDSIHTASIMTILGIIHCFNLSNMKFKKIILTGGGRKNLFLYYNLNKNLLKKKIKLTLIDKYGINGDMLEAQMFGYLAVRSFRKLPISIPTTTGVKTPITGGFLYKN